MKPNKIQRKHPREKLEDIRNIVCGRNKNM